MRSPTNDDMDAGSSAQRHATGWTIILFLLAVLALSALPVPDWLRPLDWFQSDDPVARIRAQVFSRPNSVPRKGDVAAADWALDDGAGLADEEQDQPKPEVAIPAVAADPTPDRPRVSVPWTVPARPKLEQLRPVLGFSAAPLENPCVEGSEAGCTRRALDRFFALLDRAGSREPGAIARVVHYGDSIIASDHITDVVRLRLQERFGSAGKGLLLITRYNARQRRLRTGDGSEGWRAEHIAQGKLADKFFGYTGASFTAERAGAKSVFTDIGSSRVVDVYYLAHGEGGPVEIAADGRVVRTFETRLTGAPAEARFERFELPEGTKTMELTAKAAGVRLFGVALEAPVPGVIYESIGVPGTTSEVWQYPDPTGFARQLGHRDPALIVTMLGGNDARTLHQKRRTIEVVEENTRGFLARLRASAPNADCLVVSPLDAVEAKTSGEMRSRPEVPKVIEVQRRAAAAHGCAFWDMYASMGGAGALRKWLDVGLINPDLIHPRATGGDLLGELMAEALMAAFDARGKDEAGGARVVP